jgi:hypothetical protein
LLKERRKEVRMWEDTDEEELWEDGKGWGDIVARHTTQTRKHQRRRRRI